MGIGHAYQVTWSVCGMAKTSWSYLHYQSSKLTLSKLCYLVELLTISRLGQSYRCCIPTLAQASMLGQYCFRTIIEKKGPPLSWHMLLGFYFLFAKTGWLMLSPHICSFLDLNLFADNRGT